MMKQQNNSCNQNSGQNDQYFVPIPFAQQKLLENAAKCNLSLYSPRMVGWKKDDKEGLKSNEEAMERLQSQSNRSLDAARNYLVLKHSKQEDYLKSLQRLGYQTFSIAAITTTPFITGLGAGHPTETGMILDRNLGVPYLPASSIKGVLRLAHAINISKGRDTVPDSELEYYFGTADTTANTQYRGQLIFLDAYPRGQVTLKLDIMNPHYSKYYSAEHKLPVETENPIPIKFLTVKEGTEFVFRCAFMPLTLTDTCDEENIKQMFDTAFAKVGFGGKTAIGYGRFKLKGDSNDTQTTPSPVSKASLEAGVYKAEVIEVQKNKQSIFFNLISQKERAVKRQCSSSELGRYKKKMKVKVKLSGEKDKELNYIVQEIEL